LLVTGMVNRAKNTSTVDEVNDFIEDVSVAWRRYAYFHSKDRAATMGPVHDLLSFQR
jgi:hypothetical protein